MTVTQGDQYEKPAPASSPAPNGTGQHVPLIDRVADLERRLDLLAGLHNRLVSDVTAELGL